MENFESILSKTISICRGEIIYRSAYSRIYTFPTENISGYLKYFDLKDKSLLTVGSSFGQSLGAYQYGCKNITLYDINPFLLFYGYLLITAILCLDYVEFQNFFFRHGLKSYYNKEMFKKETFNKIKPTLRLLDYDSYLFWDELFTLFDGKTIRENLFDEDEDRNTVIKSFNIYLRNETTYNKLKSIVRNMAFRFINGNLFKDSIEGKFDNIFLSNLYKVSTMDEFKSLLDKLSNHNLEKGGSILLAYLWQIDFNEIGFQDDWLEMYKMPQTKEKLKEYITEYHQIKGAHDFLWERDDKEDLVLIYRKK